jgi:hypothetical protein
VTDKPPSKHETGTDILRLEPRIVSQNYRRVITGRQHSKHVLHGEPPAANNGLATEHVWMRDDPIEQLPFIHQENSSQGLGITVAHSAATNLVEV